jgi:lipoprotein-anchoring transpeptidase ErfK/SrfK
VKRLAFAFLIIGNLLATEALAEDVVSQPLTRTACDKAAMAWDDTANVCVGVVVNRPLARSDCDKAGMSWDDNAHFCRPASQGAANTPKSESTAVNAGQPLTRKDCDLAGNDTANVCDATPAAQAAAQATTPPAPKILITIDKATQKMAVSVDGVAKYHWPVSTGKRGYSTPSGTYTPTSMNEVWYSKEWDNAPMPHAIFFMKDGHAIHGSYEVKHLGKPVSHGCVRIAPQNATLLYDLVKGNGMQNTQVVLSGETAGGEGKVASSTKSGKATRTASSAKTRTRFGQAPPRAFAPDNYYAESNDQPRRRGGFFRRLFGGR